MNKKIIIKCKTCGEIRKPFISVMNFIEDHKKRHSLPEAPPYLPMSEGFSYQAFLKERLEWKHKYFEDSRPDSVFGLVVKENG